MRARRTPIVTPDTSTAGSRDVSFAPRFSFVAKPPAMIVVNTPSVLVVGNPSVRDAEFIAAGLSWQGYRVEVIGADEAIVRLLGQDSWEFVVLDIATAGRLPAHDCTARPYRIVLVEPGRPEDAIRALSDFGAVALIEKPPHPGVLSASLLSLCRRFFAPAPVAAEKRSARRKDDDGVWCLQLTLWSLAGPGGGETRLTGSETSFLATLAEACGEPVARSSLIVAMGHGIDYYDTRRLDTFVSRLRQKVASACGEPLPLRSVHGYGYAFAAQIVTRP